MLILVNNNEVGPSHYKEAALSIRVLVHIPIMKIKWYHSCLFFMAIPIPGKTYFYVETGCNYHFLRHHQVKVSFE